MRRTSISVGLTLLSVFCLLSSASGQQQSGVQATEWDQRLRELAGRRFNTASYRLGPGDLVDVHVFGVDALTQTLRVNDQGEIKFPLLDSILVEGLTPSEMERQISQRLAEGELVQQPQVAVLIREYRLQPIFVLGAVKQPGQFQMTYPLRLIDALVLAGGILEEIAAGTVQVQRFLPEASPDGNGGVDILEVNLEALLSTGDPEMNVTLGAGDVIRVPKRALRVFYLIGEVTRPGVYEIPPEKLFLTQALAHAGGPLKTAKMSKGVLVRYGEDGVRSELGLDIRKVLTGTDPDLEVLPNDVIFVPGSTSKSILYGMLGAIPRTFSDAVTRAPTWDRKP